MHASRLANGLAEMWLILILYISTPLAQSSTCGTSALHLYWWDMIGVWYVTYDSSPCDQSTSHRPFCNESGWGNEEATVACREQGFGFGLGMYVLVESIHGVYRHIECQGTESTLAECDIGPVSFEAQCRHVAVVTQCSNVPQIYVADLAHDELFPYHLTAEESQQSVPVCLVIVGADTLTQTVHITLTTASTTNGTYASATAFGDYLPLNETLSFEPSTNMTLEQCVEIEIVDDSLYESWEVFSVQISTNTSAVELFNTQIDVYIRPNDMTSSIQTPSSTQRPPITSTALKTMATDAAITGKLVMHTDSVHTIFTATSAIHFTTTTFGYYIASSVAQPTPISTPILPKTASNIDNYASSVAHSTKAPGIIKTPVTTSRPTLTSYNSDRLVVVVGVTVTLVLVVLLSVALTFVLVSLILWLRRKTKKLDNHRLEPPQLPLEERETAEENKRLSLTNPTYQPSAFQSETQVERSETPEHNFTNPLYTPVADGGGAGASPSTARPVNTDYEYVETGFIGV